jgi:hypothetical protein
VANGAELKVTERTVVLRDRRWHRVELSHAAVAAGSTLDLNVVSWDLGPAERVVVDDVVLLVRDPQVATPPSNPGTPAGNGCLYGRGSNEDCGVLWGLYTTQVSAAEGWATPFTRVEGDIGRRFDMIKRYHDFSNEGGSGQFPDQYERQLGASGERTLYFAWTSNVWSTGSITSWRSIASGRYDDSVIEPVARRIKAWNKPVFLDFDHEMDGWTRTANGSPADYVAAYRHIHQVFERIGVDNVIWAWVPTGTMANADRIKAMYPGDGYVDWLGYDPYNFYRCNGSSWESPTQSLRPFYDWLTSNISASKPILLGEYGLGLGPTGPESGRGVVCRRGRGTGEHAAHPRGHAVELPDLPDLRLPHHQGRAGSARVPAGRAGAVRDGRLGRSRRQAGGRVSARGLSCCRSVIPTSSPVTLCSRLRFSAGLRSRSSWTWEWSMSSSASTPSRPP